MSGRARGQTAEPAPPRRFEGARSEAAPAPAAGGPAVRPLEQALKDMGGALLASPRGHSVAGISFAGAATDSRQVTPGRLFFALPGERVDGFDFCAAAVAAGAAAVVVPTARGVPAGCAAVPVIGVADARMALADLARAARARFGGKVVGVTGSNGKTTTKELCAAALGPTGVLKTQGNLNTDVGLPLTILEATGDESFWVLEMAMRARGEIAFLADIAVPHVGVVTNVAAAHLGRLGSIEEVARAKGEIWGGLADGGVAVLPAGEPLLEAEAEHLPESRKLRFGAVGASPPGARVEPCDVRILDFAPSGAAGSVVRMAVAFDPVVVRLPLPGEHNARNAAAALAVALALGVPVAPAAARLARVAVPGHRSNVVPLAGRMVLDDCYNANPASMAAALRTLATSAKATGRAYAVLGDMLELGPDAEALHAEMGKLAAGLGLAGLVALGELGARIAAAAQRAGLPAGRVLATNDPAAAAAAVTAWSAPGDWILVKASRGMRLERVIAALGAGGVVEAAPGPAPAAAQEARKQATKQATKKAPAPKKRAPARHKARAKAPAPRARRKAKPAPKPRAAKKITRKLRKKRPKTRHSRPRRGK